MKTLVTLAFSLVTLSCLLAQHKPKDALRKTQSHVNLSHYDRNIMVTFGFLVGLFDY